MSNIIEGTKMTVSDIIKKYLDDNNFDGLCDIFNECGCGKDDLIPCDSGCEMCEPAYLINCEHDYEDCTKLSVCYSTKKMNHCWRKEK